MNEPTSQLSGWRDAVLIRILVIANFLLMLMLIGPGTSHELYLALKRLKLEGLIGRSLQIWIVGSTLLATALFTRMVWKNRAAAQMGTMKQPLRLEGTLVVSWWIIILCGMAYGYMLGMGG